MPEPMSFWLENKTVAGLKHGEAGGQSLVEYRGKYYIVQDGAALMKGSRPLHHSKSSMPAFWRKVLRGEIPATMPAGGDDVPLPKPTVTTRVRPKKEKEPAAMAETTPAFPSTPPSMTPVASAPKPAKAIKKAELKPAPQTVVPANCPYCSQKHDIPVERGKNCRPFFVVCSRCGSDFAVRFAPVTVFQAQIAGFR